MENYSRLDSRRVSHIHFKRDIVTVVDYPSGARGVTPRSQCHVSYSVKNRKN